MRKNKKRVFVLVVTLLLLLAFMPFGTVAAAAASGPDGGTVTASDSSGGQNGYGGDWWWWYWYWYWWHYWHDQEEEYDPDLSVTYPIPPAVEIIPGDPDVVKVVLSDTSDGAITDETLQKILDALKELGEGGQVIFEFPDGKNPLSLRLTDKQLAALADAGVSLKITGPAGSISFTAEELAEIDANSGKYDTIFTIIFDTATGAASSMVTNLS